MSWLETIVLATVFVTAAGAVVLFPIVLLFLFLTRRFR